MVMLTLGVNPHFSLPWAVSWGSVIGWLESRDKYLKQNIVWVHAFHLIYISNTSFILRSCIVTYDSTTSVDQGTVMVKTYVDKRQQLLQRGPLTSTTD